MVSILFTSFTDVTALKNAHHRAKRKSKRSFRKRSLNNPVRSTDASKAVGKIRIGRTRPVQIGSDWQKTDWINKRIPSKSRRSPDNALKTGEVEFCAYLSCVVVSSFVQTRRGVLFSEVIADSEEELWKTSCDELTACATAFFFRRGNWQQFFTLPQSLTIAQWPDLATERERQLMKGEPAEYLGLYSNMT